MTASARQADAAGREPPDRAQPPAGHDAFAPAFVVGFPRSGTTLLATLLSRHSRIAAPPETRFMEEVVDGATDRAAMLDRVRRTGGARTSVWMTPRSRVASWKARRPMTGSSACCWRAMPEPPGGSWIVEKSPIHLLHVATLADWYPRARFLLLVRDGRDCVLSLKRVPWAHDSILRHAAEWRRRMGAARRLLDNRGLRLHVVRYEDLVQAPETELRAAMAFLGQAFEPAQLLPSRTVPPIPDWESAWKAKANETPDRNRVSAWRRGSDPRTLRLMESVMGDTLTAWGYETEDRRRDPGLALAGAILASDAVARFRSLVRRLRGRAARLRS